MGWKRLQNAVNLNDLRNASDRYCTWGYYLWDTADPGSLPLRPARDCGRPTSQTLRPGMSDCSSYRRRCGWIASRREQRSSPTNPQPTPTSKHPEPALLYGKPSANRFKQITWLQSTQTKHRPVPANATDLRVGGAVTIGAHVFTGMRTLSCLYGCAHTCTGMLTYSRARARPWHPGTLLPRPASGSHGSSANPTHSNALSLRHISADLRIQLVLKYPGGHGRRRRCVDDDDSGGQHLC